MSAQNQPVTCLFLWPPTNQSINLSLSLCLSIALSRRQISLWLRQPTNVFFVCSEHSTKSSIYEWNDFPEFTSRARRCVASRHFTLRATKTATEPSTVIKTSWAVHMSHRARSGHGRRVRKERVTSGLGAVRLGAIGIHFTDLSMGLPSLPISRGGAWGVDVGTRHMEHMHVVRRTRCSGLECICCGVAHSSLV